MLDSRFYCSKSRVTFVLQNPSDKHTGHIKVAYFLMNIFTLSQSLLEATTLVFVRESECWFPLATVLILLQQPFHPGRSGEKARINLIMILFWYLKKLIFKHLRTSDLVKEIEPEL